jgi:hypothetical protein
MSKYQFLMAFKMFEEMIIMATSQITNKIAIFNNFAAHFKEIRIHHLIFHQLK